jgi:hypothetical protein
MKKMIVALMFFILLMGCFEQPDITPPMFTSKSSPDSLIETGIDAHPDNAIYLEWEEPATAEAEGILSYYIYRGKLIDGEYDFRYLDEVVRNAGLLYDSDKYVDYDANIDTTYYYYLKSHNDFTESKETSDTVCYKLSNKPTLLVPSGDITQNTPKFEFRFSRFNVNRINNFYFRLEYYNEHYRAHMFIKIFRYDLSKTTHIYYLNNLDSHTTILFDDLNHDGSGNRYLEKGNYRWRVDAIASELGGAPETEGSESDWMYFTVK